MDSKVSEGFDRDVEKPELEKTATTVKGRLDGVL